MVEIKGLEKFSAEDFPGYISSTVFLAGCNFRCPYCHNADLVVRPDDLADIPCDFFLAYLDARKGWLEGICVSGGEPLLPEDSRNCWPVIKDRGLLVKLDTNGSFPDGWRSSSGGRLVDWLAMDVKAPLERYRRSDAVERRSRGHRAERRDRPRDRESEIDLPDDRRPGPGRPGGHHRRFGERLRGAPSLPNPAVPPHSTLDPAISKIKPYGRDEIPAMAETAKPHFDEVRIEGLGIRKVAAMELKVKRIHPEAKLPVYGHPGDAGLDLFSCVDRDSRAGRGEGRPDGIQVAIPRGFVGLIWDKSGISLKGVHRLAGVVDAGYRGEVQVVMINLGREPFAIKNGDEDRPDAHPARGRGRGQREPTTSTTPRAARAASARPGCIDYQAKCHLENELAWIAARPKIKV